MCFNLQVYVNIFILVILKSETLMYLNLNKDTEASCVVISLLNSNALVSLFDQNVSTVRRLCKLSKSNFHLPKNNLSNFNQTKSIERNGI